MRAILIAILAAGAAHAQPGPRVEFDAVSIKPADPNANGSGGRTTQGQLEMRNTNLNGLLRRAYGLNEFQLSGGPKWAESARFDVIAKLPAGANTGQVPQMLQTMLADRFHVEYHRESRQIPQYALVVAKGGPKLQEATEEGKAQGVWSRGPRMMKASAASMELLARMLVGAVQAPVIDRTGIAGQYTIDLHYAPLLDRTPEDESLPDIFGAVELLGLKLDPIKAGIEIVVIDRAEMPSEN